MRDSVFRLKNTSFALISHFGRVKAEQPGRRCVRHKSRLVSIPSRPSPSFTQSLTRVLAPSVFWEFRCSSVSLSLSPFLLRESGSKEVFISGRAMDPSPRSNGARTGKQKREAAKLRTTNGIKLRGGKGKENEREAADRHHAIGTSPAFPVVRLLPFPFLTVGRSIGSRERCTRNWPRPQTATYRASSLTGMRTVRMRTAVSSQAAGAEGVSEARTIIQTKL